MATRSRLLSSPVVRSPNRSRCGAGVLYAAALLVSASALYSLVALGHPWLWRSAAVAVTHQDHIAGVEHKRAVVQARELHPRCAFWPNWPLHLPPGFHAGWQRFQALGHSRVQQMRCPSAGHSWHMFAQEPTASSACMTARVITINASDVRSWLVSCCPPCRPWRCRRARHARPYLP